MSKKVDYQKLEKSLTKRSQNCWEIWDEKTKESAFAFAEKYKKFLNEAKTERDAVRYGLAMAKKNDFKDINTVKNLKPGDKVYFVQKNKSILFAVIGQKKMKDGFKMIMSHIDSPHLDLKVSPLYEDEHLAFFKTHYYGGIKKYQWPTIALALHGVAYLLNGKEVEINIGEKESDPVFMITDLLPHLDRAGGPGTKVDGREVKGEDLNLLVGSIPVGDEKIKEKVKLAILSYLNETYGIKEEDFASADIAAVPSEKARDLGFDRSLISAYGQDDSICAFSALESLLAPKNNDHTQLCVWIDREEIGSEGSAGAQSIFFESFISKILELSGEDSGLERVYDVYSRSSCLSADTSAALDPDYKDVYDLRNVMRIGYGLFIEKYNGSGGKYHTSEAAPEFISELRAILEKDKKIIYQIGGGLGKVDQGGGGTIAMYMANRNINTVDAGVPLLNVHAPLEIASKADLYCAYLGFKAYLES